MGLASAWFTISLFDVCEFGFRCSTFLLHYALNEAQIVNVACRYDAVGSKDTDENFSQQDEDVEMPMDREENAQNSDDVLVIATPLRKQAAGKEDDVLVAATPLRKQTFLSLHKSAAKEDFTIAPAQNCKRWAELNQQVSKSVREEL